MSRRLVLPLVVALVALVLGGLTYFSAGGSVDPAAPAVAPSRPAASEAAAPAIAQLDEPTAQPAAEAPAERTAIAAQESPTPAARASSAERAGLELTGRVVSASGAPVEGARVFLGGELGFDFDLPLDAADQLPGRRRREALSGADGRFRLTGAGSGRQRVSVRAPRFAPHDVKNVVIPAGSAHDMGDITLDLGGVLPVRVIDSRGAAVAGAHVRRVLEPEPGGLVFMSGGLTPSVELAQSGADGTVQLDTLAVGPFHLRVWHDLHPDQTASGAVDVPGQVLAPLTIVLDDGASIAGRVVGAPAALSGELLVRAAPRRAEASGFDPDFDFPAFGAEQGGEARSAKVGADGTYEVRGLRLEKDYALTLQRSSRGDEFQFGQRLAARVEARSGARGVELAYRPESSVLCQVIDARTREPIEELEVSAGIDFPMPIARSRGGDQGRYEEGRVRAGNLRPRRPEDRATLRINAVGYRTWARDDIELIEGQPLDLGVVELQPIAVVRVTVLDDATGAPVAGARVSLSKIREPQGGGHFAMSHSVEVHAGGDGDVHDVDFGGEGARSARTDARGEAQLNSLEGERCQLTASHGGFAPHTSDPFVCSPDGDALVARLRKGGTALVKLLDAAGQALPGGRVERRDAGAPANNMVFGPGANNSAITDSNGVARFERLAAGQHEFRPAKRESGLIGGGGAFVMVAGMEDDGAEWTGLEVSEGEVAELTLQAPLEAALRGVVTEAGQPLAGASLSLTKRQTGPGPRMPAMPFGGGLNARTDSRGEYEIAGAAPGEYTLSVSHPTRSMPAELNVRIVDRDLRQDVALSLAIVEGRVVDSAGKPLEGVRVWAERQQASDGQTTRVRMVIATDSGGMSMLGGEEGAAQTFSAADGSYSLRGVATGVKLDVRAEGKGLQPARAPALELAENEVKRGVELVLAVGGQAEVSVFNADGSPAQMVVITATPEGELAGSAERKTGFIQENGKTSLDGLAPGSWRVIARPVGVGIGGRAGGGPTPPVEQVIEVRPGETTPVRFDLR